MTLRVAVYTCDSYQWLLQPFSYLFNKYWSELQPVVVGGFSQPDMWLPPNFTYHRIDTYNYPANQWSDGLLKFLLQLGDEHIILFLEDYLLCRTVNHQAIMGAYHYMKDRKEVLRMDLTADRLYAGEMRDIDSFGYLDIIETPNTSPYQVSTQVGIWNCPRLYEILSLGKTGWEFEIQTKVPDTMRVLGTRQYPVRYVNAMLKGKLMRDEIAKLPAEHLDYINRQGWFNRA